MTLIRGNLNFNEALPVTVDWCSKALGFVIKEFTTIETIHGTASKILIGVKACSGNDNTADPRPDQICVKGGFDPNITAIYPGLNAIYRREAEFYYYIAPLVTMRLPKAWYCGSDTVSGQGIVFMDDLRSTGCTFGNPLDPWPVARVRAGVEQLAALHAATWSKTAQVYPWLSSGSALPAVILALLEPEAWARRYAEGERPPIPAEMLDRERMRRAFQKLWSVTDPRYNCLVHGDAHIGNTYITAAGEPGFIDWQGLAVGSAFDDVPYFIAGALTVRDRREHEVGLVEHYLDTLSELGGPRLRREEVWDEYRGHTMHGFVWALTDPHMQPKDVIFATVERYTVAMVDHGTLDLLGC
ncbi:uncharacterized protein PG986_006228 [Apiospora aurea]|uniref:CHK kinase-like domain-containing protein n=1 Tax=Apiospora aurea TaxID=335848 RepID=A0ABR1QJT2_9PEZI